MSVVLVAGGAGLLGSAVARRLLRAGNTVIAADGFDDSGDGRGAKEERAAEIAAHPNGIVVRLDMTDPLGVESLMAAHRPDVVLNAARFDPGGAGAEALVESSLSARIGAFIQLSDAALYGPAPEPHKRAQEDEPVFFGEDSYLESLARTEERIRNSSLPFVIFRVFSSLGPSFPIGRFPMSELEALLSDEEIFLEAESSRDFLHVADAARAVELALEKKLSGHVINLGSGVPTSLRRVVEMLASGVGHEARIVSLPTTSDERIADMEKLWTLLGFAPHIGIEKCVQEIATARTSSLNFAAPRFQPVSNPESSISPPSETADPARPVSRRELFDIFRGRFGKGPQTK